MRLHRLLILSAALCLLGCGSSKLDKTRISQKKVDALSLDLSELLTTQQLLTLDAEETLLEVTFTTLDTVLGVSTTLQNGVLTVKGAKDGKISIKKAKKKALKKSEEIKRAQVLKQKESTQGSEVTTKKKETKGFKSWAMWGGALIAIALALIVIVKKKSIFGISLNLNNKQK